MSYFDKNRIFFALLHYIFSEQSNVNWALKTSLVNYTGINESLDQKQYKNDSISNDIIKYVKEIKPYHVQFDHYIEKYTTKDDICNIIPSDSLFPTINVRFDAVSSEPDIFSVVYTYTQSGEPDIDNLSDREFRYLNIDEKIIYVRKTDRKGNYYWDFESYVSNGDLIYIEEEKKLKKFQVKETHDNVDYYELVPLSSREIIDLENTTAANRLFLYKTQDFDLIKDYLNAHFKGITITGGDFNIDRFGYDAFLYDLKRYEEPVKTSAYCFIDSSYTQINVGDNTFFIDDNEEIEKTKLTIISTLKGLILDYYLEDNQITLFYNTEKNEEITIIYNKSEEDIRTYKYITNTFSESSEENYTRTFIDKDDYTEDNEYKLAIPYSPIATNKMVVEIEKPNGYRKPFLDYTINNGYIYISKDKIGDYSPSSPDYGNKINWKIIISIADYSLIYDKIYTWEDIYGIANNKIAWENYYRNAGLIQNVDGNNFLNPHYEENRPSELSVIYPQNTLFVYTSKANAFSENLEEKINVNAKSIFNFDFKNKQDTYSIRKSATLVNDYNLGDTEITVSKDIFQQPYISENDNHKLIPGVIVIDSEIIEYYEYIVNNDSTVTMKKLRRGINGSRINDKTYNAGTYVYPFTKGTNHEYSITPSYYYIKNNNFNKLTINGNIPNKDLIKVFKTNNLTLLSDITPYSKSFTISGDSINKPVYNSENELIQRGFLYINDIKIEFNKIEESENSFIISEFDLPINTTFKTGDRISSTKYIEVPSSSYTIKSEIYDKLKDSDSDKLRNYIQFIEPLKVGECVIIENYNKNVF